MMLRSFPFLCMVSLLTITTKANTLSYQNFSCSDTTTLISNSVYRSNLELLFSDLSSNATEKGYYNATAGHNSTDKVYGNFLCQAGLTPKVCHECVVAASINITQNCPTGKAAIIWYDECMLRYSNNSFVSIMEREPFLEGQNQETVKDSDRFMNLLNDTMNKLVSKIISKNSKMFAIKRAKFLDKDLYTLAQCTPDLSVADCGKCLKIAVEHFKNCCIGNIGGRVLLPSCYVRYEEYKFYDLRNKGNLLSKRIVIASPISVFMLAFTVACFFSRTRAKKKSDDIEREIVGSDISHTESLIFNLDTIEAATDNFSEDNKLGEGGFGPVYKGTLPNGQEIAAKRLSRRSGQGSAEFRNEIELVDKLQHRNLVRLLGLSFNGEEKILVYEYVPNRSLDYFIFDAGRKGQLDWSRRYKIIGGIARGILYLHEDSQLRIVHRDLKASNVLLDGDMNPKISDFGMARILGVNQTQGNTCKIAGTYGYMSPEYVMCGQFSVKSDVYSFGVLILEIISSTKISWSYQSDQGGLLGYAWKFWRNGTPLEIMDQILKENSYSRNEIIRCIHIALLCVQEDMEDRPTMASVILMLNSDSVNLPLPQEPAFINCGMTLAKVRYTKNLCQPTSNLTLRSASEAPNTKSYTM